MIVRQNVWREWVDKSKLWICQPTLSRDKIPNTSQIFCAKIDRHILSYCASLLLSYGADITSRTNGGKYSFKIIKSTNAQNHHHDHHLDHHHDHQECLPSQ